MNERGERTMTSTEARDGEYERDLRAEDARAEDMRADGAPADQGRTEGMSTADMAAAMERRGTNTGPSSTSTTADQDGRSTPLFAGDDTESFRSRWTDIQTGFVDEPRRAVEQADGLVAEVIQRLAQVFADERGRLEQQWGKGDDVSTEDLRVALQRYRSFFERLLSA